jgi:catechol-2,3-dioxygenase
MDERKYDRAAEDLGNIVNVGHLNLAVADQVRATSYYVSGLGLTRDPYVNTGIGNMWINVGVSQFHLPTGAPERFRGVVGLVVPDRAALLARLAAVRPELDGTRFAFREGNDAVETTCPWGNRIACHGVNEGSFGAVSLGMAYFAFDVPPGTAAGIARFYREIVGAQAEAVAEGGGALARVTVGAGQHFLFRETDAPEQSYDGHHVQVYVCDFSGPYRKLLERGLIFQESNQHQYRFKDIVDLDSGRVLYTIDHEMRSLQHPFYGRPLVNRNPAQTVQSYRPGRDALAWSIA